MPKGLFTGSGKPFPGPAGIPGTSKRKNAEGYKERLKARKMQNSPAKKQKDLTYYVGTSKPMGPDGSKCAHIIFPMSNESRMRNRGCKRTGNPGSRKGQ